MSLFTDMDDFRRAITADARFPSLVSAVSQLANRGDSFTSSPDLIQQATAIAASVSAGRSASSALVADNMFGATFPSAPVSVGTSGSDLTFTNTSFATLSGSLSPPGSEFDIKSRTLCFLCWPPLWDAAFVVTSRPGGGEGKYHASAEFGRKQREQMVAQVGIDAFELALRAGGVTATLTEAENTALIDAVSATIDITLAAAMNGRDEAIQSVKNSLVGAVPDAVDLVVGKRLKGDAAKLFLKQLLKVVTVADTAVWLVDRWKYYDACGTYWNLGSDALEFCVDGDGAFAPCPAGVLITGPKTKVTMGQTLALTAKIISSTGQEIRGRKVNWKSSDTKIATVSDGVVTGIYPGSVEISASIVGVQGNLTVVVTDPCDIAGSWTISCPASSCGDPGLSSGFRIPTDVAVSGGPISVPGASAALAFDPRTCSAAVTIPGGTCGSISARFSLSNGAATGTAESAKEWRDGSGSGTCVCFTSVQCVASRSQL
jgi:hypothetical protein